MTNSDNIIPKEIKLLDCQIDIILRSLELYFFQLNHVWGTENNPDELERRKAVVFHTYEGLVSQKVDYIIGYDVEKEFRVYDKKIKKLA